MINHVIVSIYTPGDDAPDLVTNFFTQATLQLAFHDLDAMPREDGATRAYFKGEEIRLFTPAQARAILSFVENWQRAIKAIVCHCDAGISRSSATAAVLSLLFNGQDKEFFKGRYRPNMLVYRTLLDVQHKERIVDAPFVLS